MWLFICSVSAVVDFITHFSLTDTASIPTLELIRGTRRALCAGTMDGDSKLVLFYGLDVNRNTLRGNFHVRNWLCKLIWNVFPVTDLVMGWTVQFVCFFVVVVVFNISAPLWIVYELTSQAQKLSNRPVYCSKAAACFKQKRKKRETNEEGGDVSCCHNYNWSLRYI